MHKNKIVPFVRVRDYFDNVLVSPMGDYIGDCKTCKEKNIKIFDHNCWHGIREESKKQYAKYLEEMAKKETTPEEGEKNEG
jgi:hypothetical protein